MTRVKEESGQWVYRKWLPGKPGMPAHLRDVRRKEKSEKWKVRRVKSNGGERIEVCLSSLPAETKQQWFIERAETPTQPQPELPARSHLQVANMLPEIAGFNRKKYGEICMSLERTKGLVGRELKEFVKIYNSRSPETPVHSYQSIMRFRDIVKERGHEPLIGKYGHRGKVTSVSQEWGDYFWSLYGNQNKPSLSRCHKECLGYFCRTPEERNNFPSPDTFSRYIVNRYGLSVIFYAREGGKKWDDKFGSYIERDYTKLRAGACWVGDHCQIDVGVDSDGKTVFQWLTHWADMKTGKLLGWVLHDEPPNSNHIFEAFYRAATLYGVPDCVYIDNGKDFRAKSFSGGRKYRRQIDTARITPLLTALGIIVIWAIPYNAKAKIIERIHLKIKELFSKSCVGYRGGNTREKPEKLKGEIKGGQLMSDEALEAAFSDFVVNVLNRMPNNGTILQGKSPDQAWNEENPTLRKVREESLILLCSRVSAPRMVRRNGIEDSALGVTYHAEWMGGMKGESVHIRKLLKEKDVVWCFDENENFVGKASVYQKIDALVSTDEGREALSLSMQAIRSEKKAVRRAAEVKHNVSLSGHMDNLKGFTTLAAPGGFGEPPEVKSVTMITRADAAIEQAKKDERTHVGPRSNELFKLQMELERAYEQLEYQQNLDVETSHEARKREAAINRWCGEIDQIEAKIAACQGQRAAAGGE